MKILVSGGSGLLGTALARIMPNAYYLNSSIADLRVPIQVKSVMEHISPDVVIHLAGKVGGIQSNIKHPADYFYDNVMMNTNVLNEAQKVGCKRFIGMLSTCVYPANLPDDHYPMKEGLLHIGIPEETNLSYAYAKRMLAISVDAYNKQFGTEYSYLIPSNLYGIDDFYEPERSHFVASLIRKIHEAKESRRDNITLFGDGSGLRQFILADDLAVIIKKCIDNDIVQSFNIAPDENPSIKEIATIALKACDAEHLKINWTGEMNGVHRKDADNYKLKTIFPNFKFTSLFDGIKLSYEAYKTKTK
jgi:GDP-L-fucose synthase